MTTGRVVVFGDSIAWGSWDLTGGGWVERLKREYMLRQEAQPSPYGYVVVTNCSVPGHRVGDIAVRVAGDVDAIDPEVAVVAIGINDAPNFERKQGTPASDFERDYDRVLTTCKGRAVHTVAVTATKAHERWLGWNNEDIESINARIASLCARHEVSVVDVFDLLERRDMDKDGIHPNSEGHEKLFRAVLARLDALGVAV